MSYMREKLLHIFNAQFCKAMLRTAVVDQENNIAIIKDDVFYILHSGKDRFRELKAESKKLKLRFNAFAFKLYALSYLSASRILPAPSFSRTFSRRVLMSKGF